MSPQTKLGNVLILRPLLAARREQLSAFLRSIGQTWRIDASNELPSYLRNRLRRLLSSRAALFDAMLSLAETCGALREWSRTAAPVLPDRFTAATLAELPQILGRESARRWLAQHGVPPHQIDANVLDRLIRMARDAATPPAQHFPGAILVRRRRGELFTTRP
jgi:tRNA(Ile)-lysidine synthase